MESHNVFIVGCGAWATAFAKCISTERPCTLFVPSLPTAGHNNSSNAQSQKQLHSTMVDSLTKKKENTRFLPGVSLPHTLKISTSPADASAATLVIVCCEFSELSQVLSSLKPYIRSNAFAISMVPGFATSYAATAAAAATAAPDAKNMNMRPGSASSSGVGGAANDTNSVNWANYTFPSDAIEAAWDIPCDVLIPPSCNIPSTVSTNLATEFCRGASTPFFHASASAGVTASVVQTLVLPKWASILSIKGESSLPAVQLASSLATLVCVFLQAISSACPTPTVTRASMLTAATLEIQQLVSSLAASTMFQMHSSVSDSHLYFAAESARVNRVDGEGGGEVSTAITPASRRSTNASPTILSAVNAIVQTHFVLSFSTDTSSKIDADHSQSVKSLASAILAALPVTVDVRMLRLIGKFVEHSASEGRSGKEKAPSATTPESVILESIKFLL
eukprot:ANDGO_06543.mRNA.1 hypothetical protein